MSERLIPATYARVSSQKQADEQTIASQCEGLIRQVESDGLTLIDENRFSDEGYSGAELQRPGLEALRDRIALGLIDRVYIHSPDRLARKMAHQVLLLDEFARHGCRVVFLNQQGLPDTAEAMMLTQMQGIIAEYERAQIMERTRRGRRYAAAMGRVSVFAHAPYGYRYVKKAEGDGRARWEIDPIESRHVRLMFELVGRGCSLGEVARELAARSIATRTGKPRWDRATIRGILINPAYYGEAHYGRERLVPRKTGKRAKRGDPKIPRQAKIAQATDPSEQIVITVPAIIEEELFHRVGAQMAENRKRYRQHKAGAKSLLSGLTLCGVCGSAYCCRRARNGKTSYYRCIGTEKHRRGGRAICDNGSVKGQELERVVWSELVQLLNDPARLRMELERRSNETQPNDRIESLQRDVDKLRRRLDRLIDAYENEIIERDEFENRIAPLRDQYQRESMALASLKGELSESIDVDSAQDALTQLAAQVQASLDTADAALKRQLIELLIKQIEIHPTEIRIVYRVAQTPFAQSPANRGLLQHCLPSCLTASRYPLLRTELA